MADHLHTSAEARHEIAGFFRVSSWAGFWIELVLTAVSAGILLFAIADPNFNINIKSGPALFSALGGIVALGFGVYWMHHYTRLAKRLLASSPDIYPPKGEVMRALRLGVNAHLIAMLLTLVATQIVVGALLTKALTIPQGATIYQSKQLIEPLDIFVVQAGICMFAAEFLGVAISFWLLKRVSKA
ncbi:DUF3611 family protein [Kovacikia minuta CCNUW1]|uniref:DUF3611 family protein n=1 Tax=Kovacikia minuta TaxID=2931930 RepID=UPI001CCFC3A4|nr:DUF3611 family protein [Kovacikia minuta]UBF24213.1 DUF3611 family protein [Kovacikia minuta CCNUW1]